MTLKSRFQLTKLFTEKYLYDFPFFTFMSLFSIYTHRSKRSKSKYVNQEAIMLLRISELFRFDSFSTISYSLRSSFTTGFFIIMSEEMCTLRRPLISVFFQPINYKFHCLSVLLSSKNHSNNVIERRMET